jgi:Acyclic terpene utilisation family protein AtuA
MPPVRIGCSSGFWGDSPFAAAQLVRLDSPSIDFLVSDYLAEVTMCLLAAQRAKGTSEGFISEFRDTVWRPLLRPLLAKGIRVVTNAGGLNPKALAEALARCAEEEHAKKPLPGGRLPTICAVSGDDVTGAAKDLRDAGKLKPFSIARGLEEEPLWDALAAPPKGGKPGYPTTCNAYLGAWPIASALDAGADVVVTGRVVDSAVVLGPLLHVFKWSPGLFESFLFFSSLPVRDLEPPLRR